MFNNCKCAVVKLGNKLMEIRNWKLEIREFGWRCEY
jgi:hypothetical protein